MTYDNKKSRKVAYMSDARLRGKVKHEKPSRGSKAELSGQCLAGRHSRCASVNCTCHCGHGVGEACGYVDKSGDKS